jgi:UPF0755 protein
MKRLFVAALLGGALFVAPFLLLENSSVDSQHVAQAGGPSTNSSGHTNDGMALTSQVAPGTLPTTTNLADPSKSTVTVSPGMTVKAVAREVGSLPGHDASSFAEEAASGVVHSFYAPVGSDDLEGVLGDGTYTVAPGESDAQILYDMVLRFNGQAQKAGLTFGSAAGSGFSVYQILTVASIVQQEGYIEKNMPDVARVIYNRLADQKPLQMNSTILYPLGEDGGAFTTEDLHVESPYNSYLHTGLPPTPICSPSIAALKAALNPPPGNWIYFNVVRSDGTEAFSSTFKAQLANEKLAQTLGLG